MASTVLKMILSACIAGSTLAAMAVPAAAETPNLTAADRAPCRDPWINYAYRTQFNRQPIGRADMGECTIQLYASGKWNSYDELRNSVVSFQRGLQSNGLNVQLLNGVYQVMKSAGIANVLFQFFDRSGVGRMINVMGQAINSGYSLQSTDKRVDLGGGTTMIIR